MLDHTTETRVEELERKIAEVRTQRNLLQNKPLGVSISAENDRLRSLDQRMTAELKAIFFEAPNAESLIEAALPKLARGDWGDGQETVCLMSALVPGAKSDEDCVTAGWPEWLSILNCTLFDVNVGVEDEQAAANTFALEIAKAVQSSFDHEQARLKFLIRRLEDGEHSALKSLQSLKGDFSDQVKAVEDVVSLLRRQLKGEDVKKELEDTAKAAYVAAHASTWAADEAAARAAARAAAYAASYAARAAYAPAWAADEAAEAVVDTAARAVARAAAREDLIWAITQSHNHKRKQSNDQSSIYRPKRRKSDRSSLAKAGAW